MSETIASKRSPVAAWSMLVSAAALTLGAAHVRANDWHYQWGSTPVLQPDLNSPTSFAYGSCPYSLPAGQPASVASVGVHWSHSWLELKDWRGNLGYSPEAMTYYLCTNKQGSSTWLSSPFFSLWNGAHSDPATHTAYAQSPNYMCPDNYQFIVGAFCQTRALW